MDPANRRVAGLAAAIAAAKAGGIVGIISTGNGTRFPDALVGDDAICPFFRIMDAFFRFLDKRSWIQATVKRIVCAEFLLSKGIMAQDSEI
jgi:hypothetical protein